MQGTVCKPRWQLKGEGFGVSDFERDFVVGLGANLGEREATLASAASALAALDRVRVRGLSSVYESDAVGPPQPRYLNAAVRIGARFTAPELLERLLVIEQLHGRVRGLRWGARTLDLDILWSDAPFRSGDLCVPHACLCERAFALAPLLDVAPELSDLYAPTLSALGGPPEHRGRLVLGEGSSARACFERGVVSQV